MHRVGIMPCADLEAQPQPSSPSSESIASTGGVAACVDGPAEAAQADRNSSMLLRKSSSSHAHLPSSFRRRCVEGANMCTYWLALLVALLVMAVFTTAGLLGVITISNSVRNQRMNDATGTAYVHARVIAEELRLTTVPLIGIANLVRNTPGHEWATIHAEFNHTAGRLVELLGNSGLDERLVLQIAPSAVVNLSYPRQGNVAAEGHNLLVDPEQRENALAAIRSREMFLAGPYMLKQGYEPSNCPPELCRGVDFFWGFAVMLINWDAVSRASNISEFSDDGFMFRLERPAQSVGDNQTILAQSYDMVNRTSYPEEPRFVEFQALTSRWTLYVYARKGWTPPWRDPLIAVVVVISFFLSVLVFIVMASNKKLRKTTKSLKTSTVTLKSEQARLSALLVRQFELLQVFGANNSFSKSGRKLSIDSVSGVHSSTLDRIASVRKSMQAAKAALVGVSEVVNAAAQAASKRARSPPGKRVCFEQPAAAGPSAAPAPKPSANSSPAPPAAPAPKPSANPSPVPSAASPKPTANSPPAPSAAPPPKPSANPSPAPSATPPPKPSANPSPAPRATSPPKPSANPSPPTPSAAPANANATPAIVTSGPKTSLTPPNALTTTDAHTPSELSNPGTGFADYGGPSTPESPAFVTHKGKGSMIEAIKIREASAGIGQRITRSITHSMSLEQLSPSGPGVGQE
ncbi:hypothetical protein FOA52_004061 [Chlamydomonas sp. UWO 241]|nr:hypothetical protein FOA52_004061 [Chlamydomonas sp. UWO 241]